MQSETGVSVRVGSPEHSAHRRQPSHHEKVAYPDAETVLQKPKRRPIPRVSGTWLQRAVFV